MPDVELFGGDFQDLSEDFFEFVEPETEQIEGEVVELEDVEEDCAPVRVAPDPGAPTKADRDMHRVDHLPYRCWCEDCVKGRGTGDQHKSDTKTTVPTIYFDYLLVTKEGLKRRGEVAEHAETLLKRLVVKDSLSKMISAHVVSVNGAGSDSYATEKLKGDIAWLDAVA